MIVLPDGSYGALERLKGTYALIRISTSCCDDKIYQAKNFSRFYRNF
jgi:glucosamine 6-phosphate synthetase-like amidotransferase/phosphosugar isomerase protein